MADEAPATGTEILIESAEDESLGDPGKKALDRERAARKDAERRLKELEPLAARAKELEDANKSELDKLAERATVAEQKAQEAELRAMRLEVATEKGLTAAQAKRLMGATRDELEADALDLIEAFPTPDEKPETTTNGRPAERLRPATGGDVALNGDPLVESLKSKLGIR